MNTDDTRTRTPLVTASIACGGAAANMQIANVRGSCGREPEGQDLPCLLAGLRALYRHALVHCARGHNRLDTLVPMLSRATHGQVCTSALPLSPLLMHLRCRRSYRF